LLSFFISFIKIKFVFYEVDYIEGLAPLLDPICTVNWGLAIWDPWEFSRFTPEIGRTPSPVRRGSPPSSGIRRLSLHRLGSGLRRLSWPPPTAVSSSSAVSPGGSILNQLLTTSPHLRPPPPRCTRHRALSPSPLPGAWSRRSASSDPVSY
jgi:hypothetical protein